MRWCTVDEMAQLVPLPAGYRYARLQRSGVPALIAAIRRWHPDIAVGAASCYLREDFYTDKVQLDGVAPKDIDALLFLHGDALAGLWSFERQPDALALYGRLLVVAPEHRGAGLAASATQGTESLGRAVGAEYLYLMATLKTPTMQLAFERSGYQLVGLVPGYDRELVAEGVVKRVYEALYAKVLVQDQSLLRPDARNLTPRTQALFKTMFPD